MRLKPILGVGAAVVVPVALAALINGGTLLLVAKLTAPSGAIPPENLQLAEAVAWLTVLGGGAIWAALYLLVGLPMVTLLRRRGVLGVQPQVLAGSLAGDVLAVLAAVPAMLAYGFDPFLLLAAVDLVVAGPLAALVYWAVMHEKA